jgi:hypothetical protein
LSPTRASATPSKSFRFHRPHASLAAHAPRRLRLAIAGPAVAVLAIAGSLTATIAQPSVVGAGAARSGAAHSYALAAYGSTSGSSPSSAPQVSGGGAGGGGKAHHRLTPRQIGRQMLRRFHWSARRQFRYLNRLWNRESGWNVYATNPYSGAYGVPQAVPGWKMSSAGPHWRTSARTQVRWGLRYIRSRYGSPRRAWDHEVSAGWY